MSDSSPLPVAAAEALRRYVEFRDAQRGLDALRAASDACHLAPQAPQPHYAYGEAWLALGSHANASRAFAEALRFAPSSPDAWINLGVAQYRMGAIDAAKHAMRQALALVPDHPAATGNLAAFLRITGDSEEAETLLQGALAKAADNYAARLNLVAHYLNEERAGEALELLHAAPAPAARSVQRHWHLQHSLALLQLHRLDEVEPLLEAIAACGPIPPELAPMWHWRWVLLEEARGRSEAAESHACLMQAALEAMGPHAISEHRIMGHYDLAKFWSRRGASARAFAHWQAGHALLKSLQPFDRAEHKSFIDANVGRFDHARMRSCASNQNPLPVFIVGMPRSGTTLCEQILAAHPQVAGAGERQALGRLFAILGEGPDSAQTVARIAAMDTPSLDAAATDYLTQLRACAPGAQRIVDKMPGNYRYIGLAARMLPGARFIHCTRDPRDTGLSIFTYRFHGSHGYAHDLADLGWMISEQRRLLMHWEHVLPGRILTVALEDWVRNFEETLRRVLDFLGLEYSPACERFYESKARVRTVSRSQVRQPINARGLGRWRPFATQLAPLVAELERGGCLSS